MLKIKGGGVTGRRGITEAESITGTGGGGGGGVSCCGGPGWPINGQHFERSVQNAANDFGDTSVGRALNYLNDSGNRIGEWLGNQIDGTKVISTAIGTAFGSTAGALFGIEKAHAPSPKSPPVILRDSIN